MSAVPCLLRSQTALIPLFSCFLFCFPLAAQETDEEQDIPNNGEDVTRPLSRFDLRLEYQTGADSQEGNDLIFTVRTDLAFRLPDRWQLGLRLDVPYNWYRCPNNSEEAICIPGDHAGDTLFQLLVATPAYGPWTYAFGTQLIFPTGGPNTEFGDGKYQIVPTVAFKYDLNCWSPGSYWGVLVRQANSYAGYRSDPTISQLNLNPFLNVNLPQHWFLNFSPVLLYDWVGHRWFIPFDVMIGRMITRYFVVSVECQAAILRNYPQFNQEVEFRIGYFF